MNKIANIYRGKNVENSHLGHIAVVDYNGKLLYSYGDACRMTFARSSIKPFQAIPIIETGAANRFNFNAADLAVCCASHNGEERHRNQVLSILNRIDKDESVLKCGTHIPYDGESYIQLIKNSQELTPVYNNCSGKHAGMIATAVHMNEDIDSYYKLEHPVQQRILNTLSTITQYPKDKINIGIDGCGVPSYQLPLKNLALGFARLVTPEKLEAQSMQDAANEIVNAMVTCPEMVGGKNRYCTELIEAFDGRIVGKEGAEAVYCLGDRETGIGVAIKIEDGMKRPIYSAINGVLRQLGIGLGKELDILQHYTNPLIKNMKNDVVGSIHSEFVLQKRSEEV